MNKAKTAKVLSVAAVANMAAVGFAAPPANASANPAAGTASGATATAVPSAVLPAAKAAAAAAKPRGFVPRASSGVSINTETGCGGHVCWGLHGGGHFVAYVDEHFFNWTGCHIANFVWSGTSEFGVQSGTFTPGRYFCSKQDAKYSLGLSFTPGTRFCGSFQNVPGGNTTTPGVWCEIVR